MLTEHRRPLRTGPRVAGGLLTTLVFSFRKKKKSMIYFSTITAVDRIIPLNHKTKYFIPSSIYTGQITSLNTVLSSLDLSLYIWCQHGNLVSKENKKKFPRTTCHTYSSTKSLQVPLRSLSLARARSGDRRRKYLSLRWPAAEADLAGVGGGGKASSSGQRWRRRRSELGRLPMAAKRAQVVTVEMLL